VAGVWGVMRRAGAAQTARGIGRFALVMALGESGYLYALVKWVFPPLRLRASR